MLKDWPRLHSKQKFKRWVLMKRLSSWSVKRTILESSDNTLEERMLCSLWNTAYLNKIFAHNFWIIPYLNDLFWNGVPGKMSSISRAQIYVSNHHLTGYIITIITNILISDHLNARMKTLRSLTAINFERNQVLDESQS